MELRPYQAEAVEAVYNHLRSKDNNPCIVLPTGTGKSVVIAKIVSDAVRNWNGRVLILAHVKELLEQNSGKVRAFCPEIPMGIFSAGLKSRDTDEPVIVAGIQSVYNKACDLGAFDLIIVDEAHLIAPDGDGMYRTFLKDMKVINPHVRVIGLTATPFRLKGGLICQPENILNEVCYEAGLKEMIAQGYLAPLVSKAGRTEANLENLHIRGGEFIGDEMAAAMDNDEIVSSACREIVELTRNRKSVLIFTTSVEHCKHVAEKIHEYSGRECAVVTGETPAGERADIIARFKGETVPADLFGTPQPPLKFLANVNVLTTGFDAPNTDCVVLLRPTNSAGLLIQMVGRGTRLSPETGKTNCLAEGTMILTDRGLVPIEKVTTQMKLWDGIEFVPHGGTVFKGEQDVIEYAGLTATPDHKVWSEHHWRTHGECAASGKPISCTGIGGKAVREADGRFRYGPCQGGIADSQTASAVDAQAQVCADAVSVRSGRMEVSRQPQERQGRMPRLRQTAPCPEMADFKDWKREGQMRESKESPLCGLRGARNPILLRRADGHGALADGALRLHGQEDANRQDRQQWELRARQFEDDDAEHQRHEQEASAQSENAPVQAGASGSAVCGCDALSSDFTRSQQRGDCRTFQHSVLQAKRRVWDILNAGPRHRFTANGLLVSNCLVLDYGGNILRHGPVDMIRVKEPGAGKGGDAPAKKCPKCLALIHAAYATCPQCGFEFPPSEKSNLSKTASSAGIISGQVDFTDYEVQDVYYCVHEKRYAEEGTPRTMRVDYQVGFDEFKSEWVCPEHTGYAREKFLKWWKERAALGCPIPNTAREAVALANQGLLAAPERITVRSVAGEKFDRITRWVLKSRPVMREPGEDAEYAYNSPGDLGVAQHDDFDEIPF
ncbi:MAG: DEAD/DEAH box helicase [Clostridia bacterium]|nr:DEAD/DEAH box helicase [Clostridia bacterium]